MVGYGVKAHLAVNGVRFALKHRAAERASGSAGVASLRTQWFSTVASYCVSGVFRRWVVQILSAQSPDAYIVVLLNLRDLV